MRHYLRVWYNISFCPADIEVLPDENGRPIPCGAWIDQLPSVPALSLSHTDGVAVAVVGDGREGVGLGVDIERIGHMKGPVEELAFTSQERELLASVHAGDEWPLRLWCAKEAVAKAVGHGMVGGPRGLVVQDIDIASGAVHVALGEPLVSRVGRDDLQLIAFTAVEEDLVVAIALYRSN